MLNKKEKYNFDMECIKGILFVRVEGKITCLNYRKVYKKIFDIIKINEISNIIFNIEKLSNINFITVFLIKNFHKLNNTNNFKIILCCLEKQNLITKLIINNDAYIKSDELVALKFMINSNHI